MDKDLVWVHGEVKSPPFTGEARLQTGLFLRHLQRGEQLTMPHSRPMPGIGPRCHELRIQDADVIWRIIHRIDSDAIIVVEVFKKKTRTTPTHIIEICRGRLALYDKEK